MDADRFWSIIETARREAEDDDELCAALHEQLQVLTPEEIVAFHEQFERFREAAYSWELWGAAYLINGGCSDDGFHYFLAWLISRGGDIYRAAVVDPDSLADVVEAGEEVELEGFGYVAMDAWCQKTGWPMEQFPRAYANESIDPDSEDWDFDDDGEMQRRYPRLWTLLMEQ